MNKIHKILFSLLFICIAAAQARAPQWVTEGSYYDDDSGNEYQTWIVDGTEWIVEPFSMDPSNPDNQANCPNGWRETTYEDWNNLFNKFPTEKVCLCSESGTSWVGQPRDCKKKHCETCMSCSFEKTSLVKGLLINNFIHAPNAMYKADEYTSFSVGEDGFVSWLEYPGPNEAKKCVRAAKGN